MMLSFGRWSGRIALILILCLAAGCAFSPEARKKRHLEKAQAYCDAHPEIGAVLLPEGDTATPVFLGLARRLADPPVKEGD